MCYFLDSHRSTQDMSSLRQQTGSHDWNNAPHPVRMVLRGAGRSALSNLLLLDVDLTDAMEGGVGGAGRRWVQGLRVNCSAWWEMPAWPFAVAHGEPCLHLHISQREDLMRLFLQQTDSDLLQPSKLRSRTQDLDTWSWLSWGKFYFWPEASIYRLNLKGWRTDPWRMPF